MLAIFALLACDIYNHNRTWSIPFVDTLGQQTVHSILAALA